MLQPLDVAVASSLKTEFKKNLMAYEFDGNQAGIDGEKMNMAEVRKMLVICMIDALRKSGTLANIKKGFAKAGIVPLNRNIPLSSIFAVPVPKEIYDDIRSAGTVNNKCLNNSKENLRTVFQLDFHKEPSEDDLLFNINDLLNSARFLHSNKEDGWALSKIPDLIIDANSGIYRLPIDIF